MLKNIDANNNQFNQYWKQTSKVIKCKLIIVKTSTQCTTIKLIIVKTSI